MILKIKAKNKSDKHINKLKLERKLKNMNKYYNII